MRRSNRWDPLQKGTLHLLDGWGSRGRSRCCAAARTEAARGRTGISGRTAKCAHRPCRHPRRCEAVGKRVAYAVVQVRTQRQGQVEKDERTTVSPEETTASEHIVRTANMPREERQPVLPDACAGEAFEQDREDIGQKPRADAPRGALEHGMRVHIGHPLAGNVDHENAPGHTSELCGVEETLHANDDGIAVLVLVLVLVLLAGVVVPCARLASRQPELESTKPLDDRGVRRARDEGGPIAARVQRTLVSLSTNKSYGPEPKRSRCAAARRRRRRRQAPHGRVIRGKPRYQSSKSVRGVQRSAPSSQICSVTTCSVRSDKFGARRNGNVVFSATPSSA